MQREDIESCTLLHADRAGRSPLLLLCDHASNRLPAAYGSLGLPPPELTRHIAFDPGAAALTRLLAARLSAPALLTCYSRLLIDCNRGTDDPTLVMRLSDGTVVPGNRDVTPEEVERRIALYYRPYHDAIGRTITAALETGVVPALLSIHTFTPVWKGVPRPWHAGILWDRDDRLARLLLNGLRAIPGLHTGDNEPYRGWLRGDCLWQHGTSRGLAHALIEIRQNLLETEADVVQWADRITAIVERALLDPAVRADLGTVRHYGSRTDAAGALLIEAVMPRPLERVRR